jgi:hypothetical protein
MTVAVRGERGQARDLPTCDAEEPRGLRRALRHGVKKGISIIGLVYALTLLACASPSELRFSFDGPDSALLEALDAAEEWNRVCGVAVHVTTRPGFATMTVVTADHSALQGHAGVTLEQSGSAPTVLVDGKRATRSLFAHEIGHAIGKDHAKDGIMRSDLEPDTHVTAADCP